MSSKQAAKPWNVSQHGPVRLARAEIATTLYRLRILHDPEPATAALKKPLAARSDCPARLPAGWQRVKIKVFRIVVHKLLT
jgi:hypothetical protein